MLLLLFGLFAAANGIDSVCWDRRSKRRFREIKNEYHITYFWER